MMKKRIILRFKRNTIDKPVVYRLVKDFDLVFNILRATILPRAESMMVMEIEGTEENFAKGIEYLRRLDVDTEPIEQDISRDETRCVHCGICTSVCAPEALHIDRNTMKVEFNYERCVACELCVRVCPVKAMNVFFE
ncbi:MAG: 4Fe-4S binding protein [Syntrophorhabdus aromaticivorans]|uniref:4Fe-4S binding protein n=2 Tax=Syntrophorhabdus aromaticivorans TaxID=328301 RepID=A0A351U4P3_9BACT|nr:4Fe-4S binding protein [Syntrophorhabdus aromaticivorans]HBA54924.1 4Fe-4S dicluster domain-containing protein [Syntrophorhabdus aromaticivorans]